MQYTESGPTYLESDKAPDNVAPWIGSVAHVSGMGAVLNFPNHSRTIVLDSSGSATTIDDRAGSLVLPDSTGNVAWIAGGAGDPISRLSSDGGLRPLDLVGPRVSIRSGLVLGDDRALLVTLEGGLAMFDKQGLRPITLPASTPRIWSISAGPGSSYLVTHRKGCAVTALSNSFERLWKFGGVAGTGTDQLSGPEHAIMRHNEVIIADSRNNRLVILDKHGNFSRLVAGGAAGSDLGLLSYPNCLAVDTAGRILVSDAGNSRLIAYEAGWRTKTTLWGAPVVRLNRFQYPRSAEQYIAGGTLVADTYNQRVVNVSTGGEVLEAWHEAEGHTFTWPRHAVMLHGSLTIADSRNGRLVSAGDAGLAVKPLFNPRGRPFIQADPHILRPIASGFLLSDTYANRVAQFDKAGHLVTAWGGEPHHSAVATFEPSQIHIGVKDCHDGLIDDNGMVWVVDTGNHRIIHFSPDGSALRSFEPRGAILEDVPLAYPRSISILDGYIAIADAGNHRILVCEAGTGETVWKFGTGQRGLSSQTLNDPRFVRLRHGADGVNLTAVDYGNHRILGWKLNLSKLPQ